MRSQRECLQLSPVSNCGRWDGGPQNTGPLRTCKCGLLGEKVFADDLDEVVLG